MSYRSTAAATEVARSRWGNGRESHHDQRVRFAGSQADLPPDAASAAYGADASHGKQPPPREREFLAALPVEQTKIDSRPSCVESRDDITAAAVGELDVHGFERAWFQGHYLDVSRNARRRELRTVVEGGQDPSGGHRVRDQGGVGVPLAAHLDGEGTRSAERLEIDPATARFAAGEEGGAVAGRGVREQVVGRIPDIRDDADQRPPADHVDTDASIGQAQGVAETSADFGVTSRDRRGIRIAEGTQRLRALPTLAR